MGQKPTGPASEFSMRVVDEIERARRESGLGPVELIRRSNIGANTYYAKMRGERPFNTNEIDMLANAMGANAMIILRRAGGELVADVPTAPTPGLPNVVSSLDDARKKKDRVPERYAANKTKQSNDAERDGDAGDDDDENDHGL